MADLVHRDVLDVRVDELVEFEAVGFEFAARFQQPHGEARFRRRHRLVVAVKAVRRQHRGGIRTQLFDAQRADGTNGISVETDVGIQDLTGPRVDGVGPDCAETRPRDSHPPHRGPTHVTGVPFGIVGLDLDPDRVLEADLLECLVPFENSFANRPAVLLGDVAVEPVGDRLFRFGQRRRRILLFEPPTSDMPDDRQAPVVRGEIQPVGPEVANAFVGDARAHRLGGKARETVVESQEQAADVGQRGRRLGGRRRRGRRVRGRHGDPRQRVMRGDRERHQVRRTAHLGERRVAGVERVGLAIGPLQHGGRARNIGEQQSVGVDENRLAFRMRLRDHGRAGEQAVGERLGDGARVGRALLRRVLHILCEQLDGIADLVERDDLFRREGPPRHHPAVDPVFPDALVEVRLEEVELVELAGRNLDPDLVVLLPKLEKARYFLRVLHHLGKGPRLAGCGGRCGGRRRGRSAGRRGNCGCRGFRPVDLQCRAARTAGQDERSESDRQRGAVPRIRQE